MNREVITFRDSIFGSPDMGVSVSKLKPIYAGRRAKVLRQIVIQENQQPGKAVSPGGPGPSRKQFVVFLTFLISFVAGLNDYVEHPREIVVGRKLYLYNSSGFCESYLNRCSQLLAELGFGCNDIRPVGALGGR